MNDYLCTALVATSSDPGAGTAFHKFSGRFWAFRKRNTTSRNSLLKLRRKIIGNRDEIMSLH